MRALRQQLTKLCKKSRKSRCFKCKRMLCRLFVAIWDAKLLLECKIQRARLRAPKYCKICLQCRYLSQIVDLKSPSRLRLLRAIIIMANTNKWRVWKRFTKRVATWISCLPLQNREKMIKNWRKRSLAWRFRPFRNLTKILRKRSLWVLISQGSTTRLPRKDPREARSKDIIIKWKSR